MHNWRYRKRKKNKIKGNIKFLEDLSINLNLSINELKKVNENIEKQKEELKTDIQKTFTKFRNAINYREDQLLIEMDNKFNELLFKENFVIFHFKNK